GGACKGAGAAMGLGGCTVGAASAVFGGAAKRGRGGGATTGRETGATGAGAALVGAAMGGGVVGMRGAERRD
ncbi:MAG: peptidoglycan-binding protein, partial [Alphaproteobacteria bacterium]